MKNEFESIRKRIEQLEYAIEMLNSQEQPRVEGTLRVSNTGSYNKYYYRMPGDEKGRYLRKNETDLASALAQQNYNEHMLALARDELKVLKRFISGYPANTINNYLDTLPKARQALITSVWSSDEEYIKQWLSQEYRPRGFSPEDTSEFITNAGLRVRSKTEVNIANRLEKHGLPFLYELPRYLEGFGWVYPDFTVLVIEMRTVKIWEHHGLLDDKDYRENQFLKKSRAYADNGFFPGKNLIQTFESQKMPLSIPMIDDYINEYLM